MRFFAAALYFFGAAVSYGQTPEVPHKMQFAGMTLTIRDDARREIQKDVDALTQHPYYFNIKVERAKTYFPIIEQIFKEERLPDDFKYLALQESALISDAVSSSDAVGFWQFKDFTAEEMGMRVDKEVDERMNLISATRGAARYLKQNNFYFNNWIYALQAYQMGAGGAKRAIGDKHNGARNMEIDSHTYWYVKKYLAHKIAFENALHGDAQLKLVSFQPTKKTSLKDIAEEFSVDVETIAEHNKWAKKGNVPDDRRYTVLIPQGSYDNNFTKLAVVAPVTPTLIEAGPIVKNTPALFINEVPVIVADPGDRITTLADRGGISLSAFLRYNDISIDHTVKPGGRYFIDKKKAKGNEAYHKVEEGENLWSISQEHGIKLKKLRKYNRLAQNEPVNPATMLWLANTKPPHQEAPPEEIVVLDIDVEFDWGPKRVSSLEPNNNVQTGIPAMVRPDGPSEQSAKEPALTPINNNLLTSELNSSQSIQQPSLLHEVKTSDTLYSVARQYGVTIKELMAWNEKKDFSLSVGEKLIIFQP